MDEYSGYLDTSLYERNDFDEDLETASYDIYKQCVEPSLHEIIPLIRNLLVINFIFKLITRINIFLGYCSDIMSAICGLSLVYLTVEYSLLYLILFIIFCYITITITQYFSLNHWEYFLSFSCFTYLILSEFYFIREDVWSEIRGLFMIVAMKIISLGFDFKNGLIKSLPNVFEYMGYILSPSNCLCGPWISFRTYKSIFSSSTPLFDLNWIKGIVFTTTFAVIFLTISNCWSYWFIPHNWKWFVAYQEALSFRTSHYFISYLSESGMIMSGFCSKNNPREKSWRYIVTRPLDIEFPRSLVQVVVSWNIPIHLWLKIYVFNVCKPMGKFFAVFMTYVISSFLHGFNLMLASVLLSLGFYTYIEFRLRKKLSQIFDACIGANRCKNCEHTYRNNLYVRLANFVFSCIAIFHLAYLGCLVDAASYVYENNRNDNELFLKWKKLDYASHIVTLFTYFIYKFT